MTKLHESKYQFIAYDAETGIISETWSSETVNMTDEEFKIEMLRQVEASKIKNLGLY